MARSHGSRLSKTKARAIGFGKPCEKPGLAWLFTAGFGWLWPPSQSRHITTCYSVSSYLESFVILIICNPYHQLQFTKGNSKRVLPWCCAGCAKRSARPFGTWIVTCPVTGILHHPFFCLKTRSPPDFTISYLKNLRFSEKSRTAFKNGRIKFQKIILCLWLRINDPSKFCMS